MAVIDTVFGLPVHSLVVHGVVVLLPLAAVGAVVMAARNAWSKRFGVAVVLIAWVAAALTALADKSGERLAARVGTPEPHAELGERLVPIAGLFALLLLVFWLLDRGIPQGRSRPRWLVAYAAVMVVVAAVVVAYAVVVGHSGAEAVWKAVIDRTTPG